ncbi:MAG: hypothetical protein RIR00_801 [Pseudomonadota bacterium]
MQTQLAESFRDSALGREADAILRQCVHCGFCTATCPTYQLLGDELDGPRGRIYLIKQVLEGTPADTTIRSHLDRCLTCRSCETTCPSGVQYSRLLDIGRRVVAQQLPRRGLDRVMRYTLSQGLPRPWLFRPAVALGQVLRPLLPSVLADKLPTVSKATTVTLWPTPRQSRRMLALAGCVQPSLAPNINAATARVLDRLGISLYEVPKAGCCGALRFHLDEQAAALDDMRRNIDAWWPEIDAGVEAIVVTASGCGVQVKEYGHCLRHDPDYASKAARISALCRDPSEVLLAESGRLQPLLSQFAAPRGKLAFHAPCSLQHGLKIRGVIEGMLSTLGYELTPVAEGHLCCGSAGTYSLLQGRIAGRLRDNKLTALNAGAPLRIATANIGCLTHLQAGSELPVEHWIELLDRALCGMKD